MSQPGYLFALSRALSARGELRFGAAGGLRRHGAGAVGGAGRGARRRAVDLWRCSPLVAFGFYFFRNTSVRFWIPLAARNMRNIVDDGFKDVQRFSADWHADNFAGATVRRVSRAMNAYDTISDTIVWSILPAAIVLTGITVQTALRWPLIGAVRGRVDRGAAAR